MPPPMAHRRWLFLVPALLLGCATTSSPPLPPAPQGVRQVVVDKAVNRTGSELVVDDPGVLERYLGEKRSTVPVLLAHDLRTLLKDRGFRVVVGTASDIPTLRTEILRWKP